MIASLLKGRSLLLGLKMGDVAARSGFVLAATFALPIDQAGQFAIIATIINLFALAFGFERHIDVQRRTAAQTDLVFDTAIADAIRLYGVNYLLMAPLLILSVLFWGKVGFMIAGLALLIAIGEQLSNHVYNYALIAGRYTSLMAVVLVKNAALVLIVLWAAFLGDGLELVPTIRLWALATAISVAVMALVWLRFRLTHPAGTPVPRDSVLMQYRASATHFTIGVVAVLVIQYDRLAVGTLMSLSEVGVYLRHMLLVSLAYQAFTILSFGRVMPRVFADARTGTNTQLRTTVRIEYRKTLIGTPLLFALAWAADEMTGGIYSRMFHLQLPLMGVLLIGFMLRAAGDLQGCILNARMLERVVLRNQLIAFILGGVMLVLLVWWLGLAGGAAASILTSAIYFIANREVVRRLST